MKSRWSRREFLKTTRPRWCWAPRKKRWVQLHHPRSYLNAVSGKPEK